jgi:2-polyprenyl-6-methoxyphenol hydroxylase-like FAD-dependent oxidoreductase
MDLIDRLRAQHIPFQALIYLNKTGKQIAKLDAALLHAITDGKYMRLMHSTLEEALYEAIADEGEVRFGRSLTHIVSCPDAVEVTFNDGTTESFDLLIDADGVHSNTRALVFGPKVRFSRSLGYAIACYPLADCYSIGHAFKMYVEPGRLAAAYCTPQVNDILTFFMYQTAEREHLPREKRLARLREVFAGMGWLAEKFLSDVNPSESIFMDAVIQIQIPSWHQGRVALAADACDCPTLLSGQGRPWPWEAPICWLAHCTKPPITRRRSIATSSRCLTMSRRSKREPKGLPNPLYLEVAWVCSPNKR